jgi:anti-sigma-K factor RskA/putative zinc finger protein
MDGHEEFRELCAISLAGELTCEERARLDEHLRTCPSCEKCFRQYLVTVVSVLPRVAAEEVPSEWPLESSWDSEHAQATLFERLQTQECAELSPRRSAIESASENGPTGYVPPRRRWREFGILYAAGILLFLALTVASYRLGIQRGERTPAGYPANSNGTARMSQDNDHDRLAAELAERDETVSELKQQIASKISRARKARTLPAVGGSRSVSAAARIAEVEKQLADTRRARNDEAARVAVLEAKAGELDQQLRDRDEVLGRQQSSLSDANRLIQDRDKTIADQQDLLAHDRDIRELMGSRNLYIAEVYDVAKTGQPNKPFGRVFYTKGKSLIFYAYDLDQQPGVKAASSFQVWGSEGANQGKAVSLGVFFEDSVANKRWVLKAENAQSLEQIDAVFVTIEPKGGSQRPSGKPVLFASLKNGPNHP